MMRNSFTATIIPIALLASTTSAFAFNLGARYVNALRFQKDGTIQFTLFDSGTSGDEFICDPSIPTVPVEGGGQWFVISSCDIGNGKGNKSAESDLSKQRGQDGRDAAEGQTHWCSDTCNERPVCSN